MAVEILSLNITFVLNLSMFYLAKVSQELLCPPNSHYTGITLTIIKLNITTLTSCLYDLQISESFDLTWEHQ